ncbi:protein retinal degeneration B isoform X3 [Macrosteles quadrilineatus]|uniref:protein retinal degeneration B isoform X3 n=1 Tax=Macrosteles quadrilineatus TaxID=74068 RepID=UPI0023E0D0E4|nr:protein retinal degeneration B isoform X3 [Macrosteles quadrilineatus]
MLIKEYHIPLPLTVDEYRIAQLYMIAKKSREESKGAGSGVEILVNEPYNDGPGGEGQYTRKIYHVGSHLPGWIKSLLPKSALSVEEEAWNAYPYTKTRYTCPFVEKFSLEIETKYLPDNGNQENVFQLSGSELRNRIIDLIDVVKDQLYGGDYVREEDPTIYQSQKTSRGPLTENWLQDYWNECKGKQMPLLNGKSLMCAYKLCKVEFRYWGMQTKLEKFIHDVALRKTMLRAHRQAWAWQDEWYGLTMEDIRQIEKQTQEALKATMAGMEDGEGGSKEDGEGATPTTNKSLAVTLGSIEKTEPEVASPVTSHRDNKPNNTSSDASPDDSPSDIMHRDLQENRRAVWTRSNSKAHLSPTTAQSFDIATASWRMESIVRDSDDDSCDDDDEFFDCQGFVIPAIKEDSASLAKWSSLNLLTEEDDSMSPSVIVEKQVHDDSIFCGTYLKRAASERGRSVDISCPGSPTLHSTNHQSSCTTTVLLLVLHAGSVLDANVDLTAKKSDITTFRGAFECVIRSHYPTLVGHIHIKLVSCPSICTDSLSVLSSLSPYSFDVSPSCSDTPHVTHDSVPIGAIPLLSTASPEYQDAISRTISAANLAYQDFIRSEEGKGFNGQVNLIGDSMGSILAYDALCRSNSDATPSRQEIDNILDAEFTESHLTAPLPRRRSSSTSEQSSQKFDFEVNELFMFGSPLSLVLAYRKIASVDEKTNPIPRPAVQQVYNLFHPTDPVAVRLEPLISARFSILPPVNIPRYQKYPLGNGQPYHLLEIVHTNPQLFTEGLSVASPSIHLRRLSEVSIQSTMSGVVDSLPLHTINQLTQKWWGAKRLDYALYCPEGLANFPTNALPHLFHASYWESSDVIAFILRQICRFEFTPNLTQDEKDQSNFNPGQPREKWIRKRTSVKLKNVNANHRANDVIVKEGAAQTLMARFMYGPLDMITLAGEKVDIHIMRDAGSGEWAYLSTEVTDKTGRVTYTIPDDKALSFGLYPVKMVVRGDHTSVDFSLAVVPPKTECVVFSIDGSFTASVSVTGRDPKVRASAVDIVRHWQELGYMIIYITGRPDMQQSRVLAWLSQHNFPHGLVSFADGLSTDPLGHKATYLKNLIQNHGVIVHVAYGSSKDISVYTAIGLKPKQIFIVGKVSKKHHSQATILAEGYAAHLSNLLCHGNSRPAQGNARMVLVPRGFGHNASIRRRRMILNFCRRNIPENALLEKAPKTPLMFCAGQPSVQRRSP